MRLRDIKVVTILWILAISSCSVGVGFEDGVGAGFGTFGVSIVIYLLFIYYGD